MDVRFWKKQLERADKHEKPWRRQYRQINKRFRNEFSEDATFNILWANTSVQEPGLLSATPKPVIKSRFLQLRKDPTVKAISEALEKGIAFQTDPGNGRDFACFMRRVVKDFMLGGRSVPRVRFVPIIAKKRIDLFEDENGKVVRDNRPVEGFERDNKGPFVMEMDLIDAEVHFEEVDFEFYRQDPQRSWKEVRWIAFGDLYDRAEAQKEFGKPVSDQLSYEQHDDEDKEEEDRALVWEVWSKKDKRVYYVNEGFDDFLPWRDRNGRLQRTGRPDPLRLMNFFPIPKPAYAIETVDSLIPLPEFLMIEDQADELDEMTQRIQEVVEQVRVRALYASDRVDELNRLVCEKDNVFIPVADFQAILEKGGIEGFLAWWPIEQHAKALQVLVRERTDQVQQIFEITGLSDITRGATDPRETARAQTLKANFASRRQITPQQEIQRLFRDLFRMTAEILAEHFPPRLLSAMTGVEVTDEMMRLMRDDKLRSFAIDIETDSTVLPDEQMEKQGRAEFLTAISQFLTTAQPLLQLNPQALPVIVQILRAFMRPFKFGREVDDMLEQALQMPQQQDPDAQIKAQEMQLKTAEAQQEMQRKQQEFMAEQERKSQEFLLKMAELIARIEQIEQKTEDAAALAAAKLKQVEERPTAQ